MLFNVCFFVFVVLYVLALAVISKSGKLSLYWILMSVGEILAVAIIITVFIREDTSSDYPTVFICIVWGLEMFGLMPGSKRGSVTLLLHHDGGIEKIVKVFYLGEKNPQGFELVKYSPRVGNKGGYLTLWRSTFEYEGLEVNDIDHCFLSRNEGLYLIESRGERTRMHWMGRDIFEVEVHSKVG